MREARWGVRCIGLLLGLSLSLGGAALAGLAQAPGGYVANKNSKVFHKVECSAAKRTAAKNKIALASLEEARAGSYKPCKVCNPDAGSEPGPARAEGAPAPDANSSTFPSSFEIAAQDDAKLKFSKDIAPILAGNCMGCHGGEKPKGEFNLSTFQGLMKGGMSGEVIVPGKPDESLLVELVTTRKMPRGGGNRRLADESIERIRKWVDEGALLDAGISPTAALDKIAPSPDQIRMAEFAKLSPEQRDAKLREVALERWKQAIAEGEPAMISGKNFLVFSELPEDRAEALAKSLEVQRTKLGSLLGDEAAAALTGPEKISVYVFDDRVAYVEFARSVEQRELDAEVNAHGRLGIAAPYLAAVDPLAGGEEPKAATLKSGRSKKDEDEPTGPERSLAGLLSEQLGAATAMAGGKPPRWLADGLGAYLAAQVEPRSPYFNKLRRIVAQQFQLGWEAKATAGLGDDGSTEVVRALGFSLFEWLGTAFRQQLPFFTRGMLQGGGKLDDVIRTCFGPQVNRQQFLAVWGRFIASRYGPLMRGR